MFSNAVQKCIWCVHFVGAKMHLMRTFCFAKMHFCINKMLQMHLMRTFCNTKCYKCIWCKNAFDAKMHFGVHFPKENVQQRCAKMHLMQKCIWCKNAFDAKMHFGNATRTFSFVKCSASHFTKSNVQHHIFQRKMFSCAKMHLMRTFCNTKCYKCIWCVHFVTQNVTNAFDAKMHFGVHFPKENVQQRCAKMHFGITFSFGKCSAYIFQRKMFSKTKCYKSPFEKGFWHLFFDT